jgi:hypothetical protein
MPIPLPMKSTLALNSVALSDFVPSIIDSAVSAARPSLPAGSRRAPASNAIAAVTIGS